MVAGGARPRRHARPPRLPTPSACPLRFGRYARSRAECPKSRAAGSHTVRAARDRGLHGDLHPGRGQRPGRLDQPHAQPRLERVADIWGAVSRPVPGGAPRDPLRAPACRPLSVPAGGGAGERGNRDGLPHRSGPRAPAGTVDGARPRAVRGHDPGASKPWRGGARAISLHDRRRRDRHDGAAEASWHRRAGQRRLPRHSLRQRLIPALGARQDRDRDLPGELSARQSPDCSSPPAAACSGSRSPR